MNQNQPNNPSQPGSFNQASDFNHSATSPVTNPANQPNQDFTIRQVSELLGVKTVTLRSYCNRGLITGLKRNHAGYRIFSENQINQLRNISFLYRCGFSTRNIKTYLKSPSNIRQQILATKKQQLWQELDGIRQNIDFIERQEELIAQNQNSTSNIEF